MRILSFMLMLGYGLSLLLGLVKSWTRDGGILTEDALLSMMFIVAVVLALL